VVGSKTSKRNPPYDTVKSIIFYVTVVSYTVFWAVLYFVSTPISTRR